jgi:quinoprotein relay system zinc metallohydrolase 2
MLHSMRVISPLAGFKAAMQLAAWSWMLGSSCPSADAAESFNLKESAPGVFVHVGRQLALNAPGHDDIANIGFIEGSKCVAVIDTGGSVAVGRALRATIARSTSLPICYVINTHVHVDHVLGNFAFVADRPSFVGSATLAEAMVGSAHFFVSEYPQDFSGPPTPNQVIGPDRLVEHEMTLDLGKRRIVLRAWPRAHTDCDLTVYDERSSTLWTGDLLFRERLPALDGSVKGWLVALGELARMDVKLAIPGHGDPTHNLAAALDPERRYLQTLVDGVRDQLAAGKPMSAAVEQVGIAEKSHWLLWEGVHQRNVGRVYQELEWE